MSESHESTIAGVGTAHLSYPGVSLSDSDSGGDGFVINGIALGAGDVTVGQSGVKKYWPAEALEQAAETLEGQDLVRDHINTTEGKVGEVTKAEYLEDVGVVYEAEVASHYDNLANDIAAGLMEVSVRAYHAPEDELEQNDAGALVVEDVYFDNLSVVNNGASPSNTADTGGIGNILDSAPTVEASASFSDGQATATLSRSEAVLSHDAALSSAANEGDVDEQEDPCWDGYVQVGMKDGEDGDPVPRCVPKEEAESEEPLTDDAGVGYHGQPRPDVADESTDSETEEAAAPPEWERGDLVQWQVFPEMFGKIDYNPDNRHVVMVYIHRMEDGEMVRTGYTVTAGYTDIQEFDPDVSREQAWMAEPQDDVDTEEASHPTWEEGDLVEWQVNSDLFGAIEYTPENRPVVLVEIHKAVDGELEPTGFVITAGYTDLHEYEPGDELSMGQDDLPTDADQEYALDLSPDHSDVFVDREEALARATEIGLGSVHPHIFEGDTYYMPGVNCEEYMDATSEQGNDGDEEDESEYSETDPDGDVEEASMDELDEVYSEWSDSVNMTASQLETWSEHPCSSEASVDDEAVIKRNMRLLETDKSDWDEDDIEDAKRTNSFIDRMDSEEMEPESPMDGVHGCPSKWAISLLNWAYNPFDSIPSKPDEDQIDEMGETEHEVAGSRTTAVATTATLSEQTGESSFNSTDTMINYESADPEELGDELDDPVVVEKDELENMADKAEKAEDVEDELGALSEKLDEQDDATEVVDELSDEAVDMISGDVDFSVVEASKVEMFDEVQSIYAEELAEHWPGSDAEELADKFSPGELREKVDEHEEAELSSSIQDSEPEPEGGSSTEEELSGDDQDLEDAREEYAEELEDQGWTSQAEKVRSGEISIQAE